MRISFFKVGCSLNLFFNKRRIKITVVSPAESKAGQLKEYDVFYLVSDLFLTSSSAKMARRAISTFESRFDQDYAAALTIIAATTCVCCQRRMEKI